jgi:arylsulfatase A-like enzyme
MHSSAHTDFAHKDAARGARRVLIIGADGLRPDLLDPELMPTVARLAATGVRSVDHHAVFPPHTRVNISALATGSTPGRHGLVANTMIVPHATPDHIVDTSNYQHLDMLEQASGGRALLVESLGDILARYGGRVAVAGSGTPGATLLWTHRHMSRVVHPQSVFGIADLYTLREKLGEVPPAQDGPQVERQHYIADAVNRLFLDDPQNRVIVLWMCEPDHSLHFAGLGSPESVTARQAVDRCVAQVLAALDARGLRDQFDIFFMSDHGHSTVTAHNTLRDYLRQAAQELGRPLPPLTTASDYIYARPGAGEPSAVELAPLVEWLLAQPWTGVVLGGSAELAALPGVVPLASVWNGATNSRRPLLGVSPVWNSEKNEWGVPGHVMALTTQSALRSSHGSASPYEMHAVLIANGPSFRAGVRTALPTGGVDLLPTVLTLLGLPVPAQVDGRILWEFLAEPQGEPGDAREEMVEPETPARYASHPARLRLHRVGGTTYLHGAMQGEEQA